MNAIALLGFLGSGKTTLLLSLVDRLVARGERVVIVENERGSIGVDGRYLQLQGLNVQEIRAGCVCCDLALPLRLTVNALARRYAPQWLFLEASGVAHADELRRSLDQTAAAVPDWKFISLIDVARFSKLWSELYGLGSLIRPQVAHADLLVLTKTDTVNRDRVLATLAAVRQLRPDVPVLPFAAGDSDCTGTLLRAVEHTLCTPPELLSDV